MKDKSGWKRKDWRRETSKRGKRTSRVPRTTAPSPRGKKAHDQQKREELDTVGLGFTEEQVDELARTMLAQTTYSAKVSKRRREASNVN